MFDSVIFADWPRGLYLAKKLSEKGKKTAYVEILPRVKSPFGIFLTEESRMKRGFLESLGFLSPQPGGFCLLSSQGVWPLQEMKGMEAHQPVLKNRPDENLGRDFEDQWLSCLSFNLAGKVFEYNNSQFSDRGLNLFADYFLFEPSFKKIEQFKKDYDIHFYQSLLDDIGQSKKSPDFSVQGESLSAKEYFFLGCHGWPFLKKNPEPLWQWQACFFETDFGSYTDTIPAHFVSIKDLFLPWSHENFLSVFHKDNQLEVWMRLPYQQDGNLFVKGVKKHLESFFPGCPFSPLEKAPLKALTVYGPESLYSEKSGSRKGIYIESLHDFFQGDLVSGFQAEHELFDSL